MLNKTQLEDVFQKQICKLLPKLKPEKIRPAYQQDDLAGNALVSQSRETEYTAFTPDDNFIYFEVVLGSNNIETFIDKAGNVQTSAEVTVDFYIYGEQSSELALCLYNLIKIPQSLQYFEQYDLHYLDISDSIDHLHEIINEEWFERRDFVVRFTYTTPLLSPTYPSIANKNSCDAKLIIMEDENKVLEEN